MKRSLPPENPNRFRGHLRHYHRTSVPRTHTWNQWVNGTGAPSPAKKLRGRIIAASVMLLVLVGAALIVLAFRRA